MCHMTACSALVLCTEGSFSNLPSLRALRVNSCGLAREIPTDSVTGDMLMVHPCNASYADLEREECIIEMGQSCDPLGASNWQVILVRKSCVFPG